MEYKNKDFKSFEDYFKALQKATDKAIKQQKPFKQVEGKNTLIKYCAN